MKRTLVRILLLTSLAAVVLAWLPAPAGAQNIRTNPGFQQNTVPRNDDGSGPLVPLGFTINFFGRTRTAAWVNNNGNITFDASLSTYTPFGLDGTKREIIAPFFADVDTRDTVSNLVTFGQDTVDGRKAFGANFINVGYYNSHADKLNSFQVVLIDRSDIGPGDFDIEFNYGRIVWETGDASGGANGYGGVSASVGWSNGSGEPGTSYMVPGSLIPGSFLDSAPTALVRNHSAFGQQQKAGRWLFRARDGQISPGLSISTGCPLPNGTVGMAYKAQFEAAGEKPPFRWSMLSDPGITLPFTMTSDGLLSGRLTSVGKYNFTVSVTAKSEDGDVTVSGRCSVAADVASVAIKSACPLPEAVAGAAYQRQLEADGGTAPFTWAVEGRLPAGMSLTTDGRFSGTPLVAGSYQFQLRVNSSDDGAQPAFKQCSLQVRPAFAQPAVASCPAGTATVGVPYDQLLGASGGAAPYAWSVNGQLPAGLSLSGDGALRGIPTVAAPYTFSLLATDARGNVSSKPCAITVAAPDVRITNSCPLPNAALGLGYSQQLKASGGAGGYVWSAIGALPPGLRISRDGLLSGTPEAAGGYQFRLLATDAKGSAAGQACSLAVARPSFAISSCPMPPGVVGQAYQAQAQAVGGEAPYMWAYSGALPAGLSLSPAGVLAGTPQRSGAASFTLRALDAAGSITALACMMTVDPSLPAVSSPAALPGAEAGKSYSFAFEGSGGVPPYKWFTTDAVPAGLSLGAQGVLSGVPRTVGNYAMRVQATDALGRTMAQDMQLKVALPKMPDVRLLALPTVVAPAVSDVAAGVELAAPTTLPVQGTLTLSVTPNTGSPESSVNQADPLVRFANGQQSIRFSIPAGARRASLPIVSSGTVASSVTVSAAYVEAGGNRLTIQPTPVSFTIDRLAPVVTAACFSATADGLNIVASGYSTTRQINKVSLTWAGKTVDQDVTSASNDYFGNALSVRTGGAFTITLPVTVDGASFDTADLRLANSAGFSATRSIARCK